ncbi:MAG: hypothetical protein H0S78_05285 [Tissierellales bacterium]|nr:hypothetical protein [Tissierellales bacterium]
MEQSAYFGWQSKDLAPYGLREGYKNSADDLIKLAIENGTPKTLDTYIFPILFSYRHSLEISLKHIHLRCFGRLPKGGHNLLALWDEVKKEVIDGFIKNEFPIKDVKKYKENFVLYSLEGISLSKVRLLLKEIQEADQREFERKNPSEKQTDQNADVWRYLISTDNDLYFTNGHSIDYPSLKEGVSYLYEVLDFLYHITDEYLTS